MARTLGTYSLSANIEPNVSAPLDARDRVPTMADLTASGAFPYRYIGMETYVVAVNKKYRLIGSDPTVLSNWEEVGSGGSGGASSLDELSDVDISTPTNGQVLKYDSTSEEWVNADASGGGHTIKDGTGTSMTQRSGLKFSGSMSVTDDSSGDNTVVSMPPLMDSADMSEIINPLPTPSSAPDLDDLGDVDISNPTNGQVLKYDSTNQEWVNANDAGGTEVTPNPSGSATATLEKIQIDNTIYGIPEGADVEANPSGTATTDLTKLKVDNTIYGIPAGTDVEANPSGAATADLTKLKVGTDIYGIPNPTVPEDLEDLDNVNISTPTNGQVLKYDFTNQEWVNANESGGSGGGHTIKDGTGTSMTQRSGLKFSGSMSVTDDSSGDNTVVSMPSLMDSSDMSEIVNPLPTPASSPDLDDLGNVDISSPTDGQVLKYDSTNDEWVNANESGGGGTTVVANPSGTATADLEKLQVGNDIYGIPEGTEVVANPVTAATSVLSKLKIDDTIYQLIGGSGDLSRVVALDETARTATNTDFELADSIFNYDFLVVQIYYNGGSGNSWTGSRIIFTETLKTTDHTGYDGTVWIDGGNNDRAMCIKFTDSTHYRITVAGASNTLKGVYGLKITTEEYTKDTLFESDTNVSTFNLSHPYTNYDAIVATIKYSGADPGTYYVTAYFSTDQLVTGSRYGISSDTWYTYFEVTNTTSFTRNNYKEAFLYKIDGIKYGAYGASGGADVEANPSGTATVDLTKLKVDDTIYAIPEGTDVEANPSGTGTTNLTKLRVDDTIYNVTGSGGASALDDLTDVSITTPTNGQVLKYDSTNQEWVNTADSGGTNVIANPSGAATADLETIQIGETIYDIPGSGGGSGSGSGIVTLDHENRTTLNTSFELSRPVTDFDLILIQIYWTGNLNNYTGSRIFNVDDLFGGVHPSTVWVDGGNNDRAVNITFVDSTHYQITSSRGADGVYGVYGINISGSGGKSNKEIVKQLNTAISDGTVITLNLTKKYNDPYVFAANALPKSSWGGLVVVDEDYGVTYSSANNTLSFKTYTNKAQNYDIDWVVFDLSAVGGGGEGTEVEANPQEIPTDTLETIKIGDTVYDIASSGGSGKAYSIEDLYTGTARVSSMVMTKSIADFDLIEIEISWVYSNNKFQYSYMFSSDRLLNSIGTAYCSCYMGANNYRYAGVNFSNSTTLNWIEGSDNIEYVSKVRGIKFGASGGSSYSETELYSGNATASSYTLSDDVSNYDQIYISATYYQAGPGDLVTSHIYPSSVIVDSISNFAFTLTSDAYYANFSFADEHTISNLGSNKFYINQVIGIKLGSQGGSSDVHYSSTEQVIGTWINGKPLYQTTVSFTSSSSAGDQQVTLSEYGINNVERICSFDGIVNGVSVDVPINYYYGSSDKAQVWFSTNNTILVFSHSGSWNLSRPVYITIKYTKTTDT